MFFSKLLSFKENEPHIWERTHYLGEYNDGFMQRVTGEWAGSINNVSIRWYYDRDTGGLPRDFYERIGLGDALGKFPSRILDPGQVVGTMRADVAGEFGLQPGIPVGQGGAGALVAMLGLGVLDFWQGQPHTARRPGGTRHDVGLYTGTNARPCL